VKQNNNHVDCRIFSFVIDALYKCWKYHRAFARVSNVSQRDLWQYHIPAQSAVACCCICTKYEVLRLNVHFELLSCVTYIQETIESRKSDEEIVISFIYSLILILFKKRCVLFLPTDFILISLLLYLNLFV